ncbi:MAG: DciA family protein [Phycisphaerales bacterium]
MGAAPEPTIADLRAWRTKPDRDLGLSGVLGAARSDLRKRARSVGAMGNAWRGVVPAEFMERCAIVSFSRGVLLVRCDDSAARFELDRFLRCGGELALIRAAPAGLSKVRLVV